jgi:DNA-binding transcriptional LysR family regulator
VAATVTEQGTTGEYAVTFTPTAAGLWTLEVYSPTTGDRITDAVRVAQPALTWGLTLADGGTTSTFSVWLERDGVRQADIAIRLRQPQQPDLIQRKLFTVHFHCYAAPAYIKRYGEPKSLEDLDNHRLLSFGGQSPSDRLSVHGLGTAGRDPRNPRTPHLLVNNIAALRNAVEHGAGIAVLPDYLVEQGSSLVQVLREVEMPALDSYLVYPEEMKSVARVQAFRDFLIQRAQRWTF